MADSGTLWVITKNWILMTFIFVLSSSVASASSFTSSATAGTTSKVPNNQESNGEGHQEGGQEEVGECSSPCDGFETVGCKCKHYEYMIHGHVRQFYNVEKCTAITQIPRMSNQCIHHFILRASFNNNPLATIPAFAFAGLKFLNDDHFLAELRLSNTSLVSIDLKAFYGMRGFFRALDLSHNLLTTLPKAVLELRGLEELLLGDNRLTMESFEEFGKNKTFEDFYARVKMIDLSNNQLDSIPEIVPALGNNRLQEISLHGNPITQDLSTFVPMLAGYPELQKITWPLKTMTCSCLTMAILAKNLYSDFNFRAIYISGRSGHFSEWKPVTCDRYSETAFIGRPLGFLADREIARVCMEKVRPYLFKDETVEKPIVSPAVSSKGSQQSNQKAALNLLLSLAMILVISRD